MDVKKLYLDIAKRLSLQSHCVSYKVGAVLTKDDRIISTGWNGTPSGYINCDEKFDANNFNREEHHQWSQTTELHAEQNALLFAAKNGISVEGSILYCTTEPCAQCTKMLIAAGVKEVYYLEPYDKNKDNKGLQERIKNSNLKIVQYKNK